MTVELWKPVSGWEDLYEVSRTGQVRPVAGDRLLSPWLNLHSNSTLQVHLRRGNEQKTVRVAQLVYEAFVGPAEKRKIRQRDGDLSNCAVENLELVPLHPYAETGWHKQTVATTLAALIDAIWAEIAPETMMLLTEQQRLTP